MLEITNKALEKLKKIIIDEQIPGDQGLRLEVAAGGCSGSSYAMFFGPQTEEDVVVDLQDAFKVFIKNEDKMLLEGCTVDFEGTSINGKFRIHNPQAKKTCGCGDSFSA